MWYHSHVGSQRSDGVVGAFIVKERPVPGAEVPTEMIMTVGDWHHESSEEVSIFFIFLFIRVIKGNKRTIIKARTMTLTFCLK